MCRHQYLNENRCLHHPAFQLSRKHVPEWLSHPLGSRTLLLSFQLKKMSLELQWTLVIDLQKHWLFLPLLFFKFCNFYFLLLYISFLRKRRPRSSFSYYKQEDLTDVSRKNCLLFNENFPAEKPSPLLESILATTCSRPKLFINRTLASFPVQNMFFFILSRKCSNYISIAG